MPEEKPAVEDPILVELRQIRSDLKDFHKELQQFRYDTHGRLSALEGGFEQMDKRMGRVETSQAQIIWGMISGFLVTILAILLTKLL